jgi:DNA polymerase-4
MTEKHHRWIMHVDMDAFFASIEQRDDPTLRGKPVVVGAKPGGRGVVATSSYEARKFGIRSAMPINEAHRRCPDAVYLRPDMPRYAAESQTIMQVLESISPIVEPVSIDEAFVDITGLEKLFGPLETIAHTTKQRIFASTRLTASVGIGPNRLIAKLASDYRKPDGVTIVEPDQVLDFLGPMPVRTLRGIGGKTAERIERLGFHTIAELRRCPRELLAGHFGIKSADLLYNQSRGIGSDVVGDHGPRKSISRETTFSEDIRDWELLHNVLLDLAADVGRQTRAEGLAGRVVTLKIRFTGFETHTRRQTLETPTNHDTTIFRTALALTKERAFQNKAVRLIGVGLSDWSAKETTQMDLFATADSGEKDKKLYAALDEIQIRWGKQSLRLGMQRKNPR